MKKDTWILLLVGMISLTSLELKAQSFCYNQNDKMLNIGISPFTYGFGYAYAWSGYTNTSSVTFPALNVNYQIGFHEFISAGVLAGRFSRTYSSVYQHNGFTDEYKDTYSYTMIGALAEVHLENLLHALELDIADDVVLGEKIDIYAAASTGLFISSWKSHDIWYEEIYNFNTGTWEYNKQEREQSGGKTSPFFRTYVGGRYMFSPNIGGFLELGYASFGYFNIGITVKH